MKDPLAIILLVALVPLFSGCPLTPGSESGPAVGGNDGGVLKVDDLFAADPDLPGRSIFKTNDPAYWGPYGYTLWTLAGTPLSPFISRQVQVNKVSGDGAAGYGMVFCHYDTGDPFVGETMLVAMIDTQREFIVGEVTGASFSEIVPWTESEYLRTGYNQSNVMKVAYDAGEREFALFLNGGEAARFRDDNGPFHDAGGGNGYIVVISPRDEFPLAPVHVIFQEE
jgi:hypothetical protein